MKTEASDNELSAHSSCTHPAMFLSILLFCNKHFLVRSAFTVEKMKEYGSQTCVRFFKILFCDTVQFGRIVPTFQSNLLPSLSVDTDTADSSEALVCTFPLENTASHSLRHECVPT